MNTQEFSAKEDDFAIVALIDRSGSMNGTKSDTIGGFNTFKKEQAAIPGRAYMSVTLFANNTSVLFPATLIGDVPDLDTSNYITNGHSTALYDAVGETIKLVSKSNGLPKRVLFLIITDGQENSSATFVTPASIRALIEEKQAQGWEFVYMGADASAWSESRSMGFASAGVYDQTSEGIGKAYANTSANVTQMRSSSAVVASTLNWSTANPTPTIFNGVSLTPPPDLTN